MERRDRSILVLSGPSYGGKSTYLRLLKKEPEYAGSDVFTVSVDAIRVKYYAKKAGIRGMESDDQKFRMIYDACTEQERAYAYTLMYQDIERALIIDNAKIVLAEMLLRTVRLHQMPLLAMVENVQATLGEVERQRALRQKITLPHPSSSLTLRVVLLYCDFATAMRRVRRRMYAERETATVPFAETMAHYEFPRGYPVLAVDTSDEEPEAEAYRLKEIKKFFAGEPFDAAELVLRSREAQQCIADLKEKLLKILTSEK